MTAFRGNGHSHFSFLVFERARGRKTSIWLDGQPLMLACAVLTDRLGKKKMLILFTLPSCRVSGNEGPSSEIERSSYNLEVKKWTRPRIGHLA